MINVEHEGGSVKDWAFIIENCIFCDQQSRYWHKESNSPVCLQCAQTRHVHEISLAKKDSYEKFKNKAEYGDQLK